FGRGQGCAQLVDAFALLVMRLLVAGQLPRRLAQVDLALDNAPGGFLLMTAVNQPALVDQFPFQRRYEKESKIRVRVPECQERVEALRDVTRPQQSGHRMRRVQPG